MDFMIRNRVSTTISMYHMFLSLYTVKQTNTQWQIVALGEAQSGDSVATVKLEYLDNGGFPPLAEDEFSEPIFNYRVGMQSQMQDS